MPWTLGSEIHVDNLHARENVHIDGDPITLSALAEPGATTAASRCILGIIGGVSILNALPGGI